MTDFDIDRKIGVKVIRYMLWLHFTWYNQRNVLTVLN